MAHNHEGVLDSTSSSATKYLIQYIHMKKSDLRVGMVLERWRPWGFPKKKEYLLVIRFQAKGHIECLRSDYPTFFSIPDSMHAHAVRSVYSEGWHLLRGCKQVDPSKLTAWDGKRTQNCE